MIGSDGEQRDVRGYVARMISRNDQDREEIRGWIRKSTPEHLLQVRSEIFRMGLSSNPIGSEVGRLARLAMCEMVIEELTPKAL